MQRNFLRRNRIGNMIFYSHVIIQPIAFLIYKGSFPFNIEVVSISECPGHNPGMKCAVGCENFKVMVKRMDIRNLYFLQHLYACLFSQVTQIMVEKESTHTKPAGCQTLPQVITIGSTYQQ